MGLHSSVVKAGLGLAVLAVVMQATWATNCSTPLGVSNGYIVTKGPYGPGDTVMYNCMTGFRMSGTPSQLCNDTSFEWEGLPPNCTLIDESTHTTTNIIPYWVFLVAAALLFLCLLFIIIVACLYCSFKRRSHEENQIRVTPAPVFPDEDAKYHFTTGLFVNHGISSQKSNVSSNGTNNSQYSSGTAPVLTESGEWMMMVGDHLPNHTRRPCFCNAHAQMHYHFRHFTETKEQSTMTDDSKTKSDDAKTKSTDFKTVAAMVATKATVAQMMGRDTQLAVKNKPPPKKLENKWVPHSHSIRYSNQSTM